MRWESQQKVDTMELFSDKSLAKIVGRIQTQKNWYLWPENDPNKQGSVLWSKCPGYSYDLPKEEQVRTELACELRDQGLSSELEWNYYLPQDLRHTLKQEVDIAVFEENSLHLVEVKRIWNELDIWVDKPKELILAVQSDEMRLRRIMNANQAVDYQFDADSKSFKPMPQKIEVFGYLLVACFSFDQPMDISNEIPHRMKFQAQGQLEHVNEKRTRTVNFSLTALQL